MKRLFIIALAAILLSGCSTVHYRRPVTSRDDGVYHRVKRGENLWGISKSYSVSLDDIVRSNRLPDADTIEVGQMIFIPGKKAEITKSKKSNVSTYEKFIWPIKGKVICGYNSKDKYGTENKGIDISAGYGRTFVASRSGKVTYSSDFMKGYGKIIILDHEDGHQTVYAYNADNFVKTGDYVKQNQVIGKVGKGGRAIRPSLHFEIRKKQKTKNPYYYLSK